MRVGMVGHHRRSVLFKERVGTTLTVWSDLELVSFVSSKVPRGFRAVVVLVDFFDVGWKWVTQAMVVLEYYNPRIPIYIVWTGTPPEGGKKVTDLILECCEGISVDFEILSEADFMLEMKKLSVKKTAKKISLNLSM
jgi:hypothetical protein